MKLEELKIALIQSFFKSCDHGIDQTHTDVVFESLNEKLNGELSALYELTGNGGISSEPSKAFRKFTEGRKALLTINEDDGNRTLALFAAVRVGTEVMFCDLTNEDRVETKGNLTVIKQALRQAKNRNDDIYFSIKNDEAL